ncbi:zinc ribbon domain-containing protein [Saccharothrix sp. BKS2]|uniref:NADase-type glycan-binding domain-containing protein n=1 Tax=Saccharothrix sp. BKS2 TaxID=3064400 RepID=UPI0039E9D84F
MMVCAQCGERNGAGAEFCGACGTYLEWEPRPNAPHPVPPHPVPSPPVSPQPATSSPATSPATSPPATSPPSTAPPTPAPPLDQVSAPPPGDQPPARRPAPMRPTDRKAPTTPTPRLTERREPRPGDLICGQCGEANAPTRRFCSRCGSSLTEAEVVARPWWRRLLPERAPAKAGTRRRRTGVGRLVGRVLRWSFLVALLGAVGLYGLVPAVRGGVDTWALDRAREVRGIFGAELTPVRPTAITATAEAADHPALLAADNAKNTFWLAPVVPEPPALVLDFGREVDLREAIVRIGDPDDFQSAHRPKKLHLVYPTGRAFDVELADTPDEQRVGIGNSAGASQVEVHVVELHRSLRGDRVALAEIEFFAVR